MNASSNDPLDGLTEPAAGATPGMNPGATPDPGTWDPALDKPVRKGGFPRWLWIGCGCGCLTMLLLAVAAGVGSWMMFKDADDPDVQWPRLREVLHFDERPEDLTLIVGVKVFSLHEEYHLRDYEDDYSVVIRSSGDDGQVRALMDPNASTPGVAVEGGERLEREIQGRSVQVLRFDSLDGNVPFLGAEAKAELEQGPGLRFLLPREGSDVVVELRSGEDGEPVPDAVVEDFFEHFDVWR